MSDDTAVIPRVVSSERPKFVSYREPFQYDHTYEFHCPHGMTRRCITERELTTVSDWREYVKAVQEHLLVLHLDIWKCQCPADWRRWADGMGWEAMQVVARA